MPISLPLHLFSLSLQSSVASVREEIYALRHSSERKGDGGRERGREAPCAFYGQFQFPLGQCTDRQRAEGLPFPSLSASRRRHRQRSIVPRLCSISVPSRRGVEPMDRHSLPANTDLGSFYLRRSCRVIGSSFSLPSLPNIYSSSASCSFSP